MLKSIKLSSWRISRKLKLPPLQHLIVYPNYPV
jgi:hypothetical protein